MKDVRGYIFSRAFMGERVPQSVQNIIIREYCQKKGLNYLLSATEYSMNDCFLILNQTLSEINNIDGLVMYSLFQLPKTDSMRLNVYRKIIDLKKDLHFALESFCANDHESFRRIENIWQVKKLLEKNSNDDFYMKIKKNKCLD